jgi:hypothetical protein
MMTRVPHVKLQPLRESEIPEPRVLDEQVVGACGKEQLCEGEVSFHSAPEVGFGGLSLDSRSRNRP